MDARYLPSYAAARPPLRLLVGMVLVTLLAVLALACSETAGGGNVSKGTDVAVAEVPRGDTELLPKPPEHAIGAEGFSRYVYGESDGHRFPILIEGPAGQQVRCQDEELPCSYMELKALHESGGEIPEELHMTKEKLAELVGQLDVLSATLASFESIDDACAAGYRVRGTQKANMGIHMIKPGLYSEFDPADPHIVLFAKEGGEEYERDEIGECVGGRWEGEEGYQVVGAAFIVALTEEHPEGFAGPLDNWHLHFNACVDENNEPMNDHHGDREGCEAAGGVFQHPAPWMIHAYVVPEFDSQSGVFAMHNESIWPTADVMKHEHGGHVPADDGSLSAPITNFSFGRIAARVNQNVVFTNWDGVPHTVTSGTPGEPTGEFDSGALGTGQAFELAFSEAGDYRVFCTLHPSMTATVVVR